jgi:hypothetical protein
MKSILLTLSLVLFSIAFSHAQTGHEIDGTVIDSTKLTIPGSVVTLTTEIKADSTTVATDANGKFAFKTVNGSKITLSVSSLGYQGVRKHFAIANDGKAVVLNPIVLRVEANVLKQVNIKPAPIKYATMRRLRT